MVRTKEEKAATMKVWREKNKEREALSHKAWRNTPAGIKSCAIKNWKKQGIISVDFNKTYEEFINTSYCEICFIKLSYRDESSPNISARKSLDHNHLIKTSHNVRNIVCNDCNVNNRIDNKSGNPNISWTECKKKWRYQRRWHGVKCDKFFKTFVEACIYKKQVEDKFVEKNKGIMFREIDEERKKE